MSASRQWPTVLDLPVPVLGRFTFITLPIPDNWELQNFWRFECGIVWNDCPPGIINNSGLPFSLRWNQWNGAKFTIENSRYCRRVIRTPIMWIIIADTIATVYDKVPLDLYKCREPKFSTIRRKIIGIRPNCQRKNSAPPFQSRVHKNGAQCAAAFRKLIKLWYASRRISAYLNLKLSTPKGESWHP